MELRVSASLDGIDWATLTEDLRSDRFDSGRNPVALERSFRNSAHTAVAWDGPRVVGTARLLSDGVCNAYLVDVWTLASHRRRGIGSRLVRSLLAEVSGQHVALQTDDAQAFYASLGFAPQPELYSLIVGAWLDNDANRS